MENLKCNISGAGGGLFGKHESSHKDSVGSVMRLYQKKKSFQTFWLKSDLFLAIFRVNRLACFFS